VLSSKLVLAWPGYFQDDPIDKLRQNCRFPIQNNTCRVVRPLHTIIAVVYRSVGVGIERDRINNNYEFLSEYKIIPG